MLQKLNIVELNGAEGIVVDTDDYYTGRFAVSIKKPVQFLAEKYKAGIKVKVENLVALSNLKRAD
jgi:hypothetical protein